MSSTSRFLLLPVPDRPRVAAMRLCRATIIMLVLTIMPRLTEAAGQTLLLEVQINGHSTDKIGEFTLRDGALLARRGELHDLGFRVPDAIASGPDGLISLSDLPGLTWRLVQTSQTLYVTAANDRLLPALLQPEGNSGGGTVESGTGATLNYDITGTGTGRQNVANGLFDLRAFSRWGVVSSGLLAYAGGGPGGPGTESAIRLDSTYTLSDPDTLRRYRLGDFITGGLGWTRPVRLGGAQITSDFSMRPDLVTFPVPLVSGSAAVPSTVDVLANGIRLFSHEVEAGPFEIPQLPVVTGAGTISMTLTNALGRQVVATLPFYASSALLAPGLQTFSVQAGAVRRNWGLLSNDYGNFAATATWRRGLSSALTVEASAEGTAGTFMAGSGLVVNVGNLAMLNVAAAASTGSGGTGTQLSVGVQRLGAVFSFSTSVSVAGHDFRDIAAMNGDPVPRLRLNASVGLSLGRFGSVGAAYAGVYRDSAPSPIRLYVPPGSTVARNASLGGAVYFQPAQHTHILSASYSVPVRNMSIYVTGFRDFASNGSSGILAGLTIPLGTRSSVSASVGSGSSGGYRQVQAAQSPVTIGDWGYQLYGSDGNSSHEFAQLQYKSPWALLTAGADRVDGQTSLRLESQGAVSFVDGGLFASNTIEDSFAVVDTDGLEHVRVLYENRDAGRTNSAGRRLVPDLRSFDVNHIGIEPTDIPPDAAIAFTTREVRPQDRSGVVVRFPVQISHGALLRLVDEAGTPVAVGSTATLRATGTTVPVGYDGNAYVLDLDAHNELDVERPDGRRCSVAFDYRPVPGDIPTIGPLPCREQKP
ncbi:fimbria/pilus outer membrane usher protein [Burkholderia pyrrocinia]|uniref:fimbria/pilus outer membrane usher protein n=2 Tax=Burkholderia TaxID=32008 RepID=UPI001FC8E62D|nr:fimbria/pilus outer membrane usher protein [Burkholderia pyrrocinia]